MRDQGTARRARAYRLTDEGMSVFQAAVAERLRAKKPQSPRPSRAAVSTLLVLDAKTVKRILDRTGNDRSVLQYALREVGIEWEDRFGEVVPAPGSATDAPAPPGLSETPPAVEGPRTRRARSWGLLWVMGCIAAAAAAVTLMASNRPTHEPTAADRAFQAIEAGRAAYHGADYARAERHLHDAIGFSDQADRADGMAEARRLLGDVRLAQGERQGARKEYEAALGLRKPFPDRPGTPSVVEALASLDLGEGKLDAAERGFEIAYAGHQRHGDTGGQAEAARGLGMVAARRKDHAAARRWYDRASEILRGDPEAAMHTHLRALRAALLVEEGKAAEAVPMLRRSLREWESRGHTRWIAQTNLQLARTLRANRDPEGAARAAKLAEDGFGACGDQAGVAAAAAFLRGETSAR